jgi:small subunit ribosomal protein S6
MNIECDKEALDELENAFRFNDAVLRNLIIRRNAAVTEPSPLLKGEDEGGDERGERSSERRPRRDEEGGSRPRREDA